MKKNVTNIFFKIYNIVQCELVQSMLCNQVHWFWLTDPLSKCPVRIEHFIFTSTCTCNHIPHNDSW